MLLGYGQVPFFGSMEETNQFFKDIGHPVPALYSPVDWYTSCLSTMGKSNYITNMYITSAVYSKNKAELQQEIEEADFKQFPEEINLTRTDKFCERFIQNIENSSYLKHRTFLQIYLSFLVVGSSSKVYSSDQRIQN